MTSDRLRVMAFPSVSRISGREAGACALASLCAPAPCVREKGTVKPTSSVMRVLRLQSRRSSLGENEAFPFHLPGPQGGVWHVLGCLPTLDGNRRL